MARRNAGLLELVAYFPWQAGVALAGLVYGVLTVGLPLVTITNPILKLWAQAGISLAPLLAGMLLFGALLSFVGRWKRARLLNGQTGLASIQALSWREFEQLVGEYYRRQDYAVEETGQRGADGGVDLRLQRDGQLTLVQCKRWRSWKVGVNVVREMLGSMSSFGASGGVVVTSGLVFSRCVSPCSR